MEDWIGTLQHRVKKDYSVNWRQEWEAKKTALSGLDPYENSLEDLISVYFKENVDFVIAESLDTCLLDKWDVFTGFRCEPATLSSTGFAVSVREDQTLTVNSQKPCECENEIANCRVGRRIQHHPAIVRFGVGKSSMHFQTRLYSSVRGLVSHEVTSRLSAEEACRNPQNSAICWLYAFCVRWEASKGQLAMLESDEEGLHAEPQNQMVKKLGSLACSSCRGRVDRAKAIAEQKRKLRKMNGWMTTRLNPSAIVMGAVSSAWEYVFPQKITGRWWEQEL
uniref:Uncharacterized protein n=1 Tax=Chromera velia CCMP2878 TaxID=1169474 RepID=A0A0G4HY24_9ALVE|eukprot:Cvel_1521.t1-p1 / transcript=Cvel_1521.t1 / gene=Cvel_1521 / organism=Chromera_velia_CCMP2878 / gene_product=hypothetical protein / transcript_product=hypothetical protein / location=Cvel_scaffold53:140205-141038(-) / protein_length=278 / sequence_SO=supercontig / SO=protein_coding / is_pseudo=false